MIGDRIRRARLAAGYTLSEVVDHLTNEGLTLTKAGLSKYELGGSTPSASILLKLAKLLSVRVASLMEEQKVKIEWLSFRMHSDLGKRKQDRIKAIATDVIEKHVWLQETLNGTQVHRFPKRLRVVTPKDAEDAATKLRKNWGLGELPIASVTGVIEDNGGIAVHVHDGISHFHGLSGWANRKYPITITNGDGTADRIRFNLAHELGHLVMDSSELRPKDAESLAHRFAAAFIVPSSVARQELGDSRKSISFSELASLKKKHGLSMMAWIYRAKDLEIVSESHANALFRRMSANKWRKVEPVEFSGEEKPRKLLHMTWRALAERIISETEAAHLCPDFQRESDQMTGVSLQSDRSPADVLKMPREQREAILNSSAGIMKREYEMNEELTAFEEVDVDFLEDAEDE